MKVGTDGILLRAWAQAAQPNRILVIGTGTSLIALMMAQRFPHAIVDFVEIESNAAEQKRRCQERVRNRFSPQLAYSVPDNFVFPDTFVFP